jgi:hypothetical protein
VNLLGWIINGLEILENDDYDDDRMVVTTIIATQTKKST